MQNIFTNFIDNIEKYNLHKNIDEELIADDKTNITHKIFYGPKGVGKYSHSLKYISQFSKSKLKYAKRIQISYKSKEIFMLKISDIHYEIDMSMLGCNPKSVLICLYEHIVDIISSNINKYGIIICKNFENTNNEVLEIFYNYMNKNNNIKFILLTSELSFIPNEIINCCDLYNFKRPTKQQYNKIINSNKLSKNDNIENIINIKDLQISNFNINNITKKLCDKIIDKIINYSNINLLDLRNDIYDILTYDLNVYDCLWYIVDNLYKKNKFNYDQLHELNKKIYDFSKLYNNNYRPIFHIERIILYITLLLNK
jgi:hypothetical protein